MRNLAHFAYYMFPKKRLFIDPLPLVRLRSSWTFRNSVKFLIFGTTEYKNRGILMKM